MRLAGDLDVPAVRYQGNWIPHQMRAPVEDGVFFVGDSAGHCLPTDRRGDSHRAVLRPRVRARAAARPRRPPDPRAGPDALRRLLRGAPLGVHVAAARAALGGPAEPLPRHDQRAAGDGPPILRRLVLRPLPRDRAAGVRLPPLRAGQERRRRADRPPVMWSLRSLRPCSCARPWRCSIACAWRTSSCSSRSCSSPRRCTRPGSSAPSRTTRSPSARRSASASPRSRPPAGC